MKANSKILVSEDLNTETPDARRRSRAVREHAVALAKKLKAPIDLVHAEDLSLYPVEKPYYRSFLEDLIRGQKKNLKKMAGSSGVKLNPVLVEGAPLSRILELSNDRKKNYGLIVMGTQGRTGLKRLLLGSVAEEVIRHSNVPVMTVGPKAQRNDPQTKQKVPVLLVATDLGKSSRKAEEFAAEVAARLGGEVVLFHCIYEGLHPTLQTAFSTPTGVRELESLMRELRTDATRKLRQKEQALREKGIRCRSILEDGIIQAEDSLLKNARQIDPVAIVMGTHGRSLLTQAFLGSTARATILGAPVPVITVKSK